MKVIPFICYYPHISCINGYVAVPPTNKYYGYDYFSEVLPPLSVHGGVTFSEAAAHKERTFKSKRLISPEYVSRRLMQLEDCEYLTENCEIPDNYWVIGFDTNHFGDSPAIWTKEAVSAETMRLAEQLEKFCEIKSNEK